MRGQAGEVYAVENARGAIQLLGERPELRGLFPIADAVDAAVREGA